MCLVCFIAFLFFHKFFVLFLFASAPLSCHAYPHLFPVTIKQPVFHSSSGPVHLVTRSSPSFALCHCGFHSQSGSPLCLLELLLVGSLLPHLFSFGLSLNRLGYVHITDKRSPYPIFLHVRNPFQISPGQYE